MLSASSAGHRQRGPAFSVPAQRVLAAFVALLAVISVLLGLRLGVAAIKEYQASSFLSHWQTQRQAPSERAWQVAAEAMQQAQAWYPAANPALHERFGTMWQWRSVQASPLTAEQQQQLAQAQQQALSELRQATALRPRWPFAWSSLAYAKLQAGELDAEFSKALQQAQHYGPARHPVQERIAEIGLIAWPQLSAADQQLVTASLQFSAAFSPKSRRYLLQLADELQRQAWLCQLLADQRAPCSANGVTP
ncbi:hypothetical protein [Thiopseudomonas alkaliphila]|uniref:hypothetical protein n=1 Tax=Thiopseudomonas alkaliphila TaxID=1697053 RepID=UPI0025780A1D|nr:hypothetical protein [Thiopseudomonas alkaliphila]MDM1707270.1 hypothetical protein [Thiopseudomonas alkaliphila]